MRRLDSSFRGALPCTEGAAAPGKEVKAMSKKVVKIGRNAGNGRFTTVKTAVNRPKTHIVETIKK